MNTFDSNELTKKYPSFFKGFMPRAFKREWIALSDGFVIEQLSNHYNKILEPFQHQLFSVLMKAEWLDRHIVYNGHLIPKNRNRIGHTYNHVLKYFWLEYIGFSRVYLLNPYFKVVRGYADDLFPNFDEIDALEYDFPYPFKYMKLECLYLVHLVPERLMLLREGERKGMSIGEFEDYVAAWCSEQSKENRYYRIYDGTLSRGPRYVKEVISLAQRLKEKKI